MKLKEFAALLEAGVSRKSCVCNCDAYAAWSEVPEGFKERLDWRGGLENYPLGKAFETVPFSGKNYWDADYPVAIGYYPQTDADVLLCASCGAVFLACTELSGHFPQPRVRCVRFDLLCWPQNTG